MASMKRWLSGLVLCMAALALHGCCMTSDGGEEAAAKKGGEHAEMPYSDKTYAVLMLQPTKLMNVEGLESGRYLDLLSQHASYMASVNALPKPVNLVMGGTFFQGEGAMYVFEGTAAGELWQISAKDPMVLAGLYKPTVRSWWTPLSTIDTEVDGDAFYYVRFGSMGHNWNKRESLESQPGLNEHVEYLADLMGDGSLALGGPFVDELGGAMTLYRASTSEDFDKMVENDPWTKSGMYNDKYHAWLVSLK